MFSIAFRIGAFAVGLLLVALGTVGLFLPFLQGFLLIALGLSLMSLGSRRVARFVDRQRAIFGQWRDRWRRRAG